MSRRNPRVNVLLTCGHYTYWPRDAVVGEARTCPSCADIATVTRWWMRVWHARCVAGCQWGRFADQSRSDAERLARHHKHRTIVVYDYVDESWREPLPDTTGDDMLPGFDTPVREPVAELPPPF